MQRISSAEFIRNFSAMADSALSETIIVTRNGRDRVAILNVVEYRRLADLAATPRSEGSAEFGAGALLPRQDAPATGKSS